MARWRRAHCSIIVAAPIAGILLTLLHLPGHASGTPILEHECYTGVDQNATEVDCRGLGLTGTIPRDLAKMWMLRRLNLSGNELTGNFPLRMPSKLTTLAASGNKLTGTIPTIFTKLVHLQYLNLAKNHLSGTIPEKLGKLTKLEMLNLFENAFTGTLPATLGKLTNLRVGGLGQNHLTGTLPHELEHLTHVQWFQLTGNEELTVERNEWPANLETTARRPSAPVWGPHRPHVGGKAPEPEHDDGFDPDAHVHPGGRADEPPVHHSHDEDVHHRNFHMDA